MGGIKVGVLVLLCVILGEIGFGIFFESFDY